VISLPAGGGPIAPDLANRCDLLSVPARLITSIASAGTRGRDSKKLWPPGALPGAAAAKMLPRFRPV